MENLILDSKVIPCFSFLANDIHLVGRSFKYHRPRGIMTSGSEEPNAIVQVNNNTALTEPNVRATEA